MQKKEIEAQMMNKQGNMLINNLNTQVNNLLDTIVLASNKEKKNLNSTLTLKKSESDLKEKEHLSEGSISSADEKDMELLFNGAHTYQFQAVQRIQVIQQDKQEK